MIFGNRSISAITDNELKDLIGKYEDQWVEFKLHAYHHSANNQVDIGEICKDIAAMANAEGGYIFIGVGETSGLAQKFVSVANSAPLVHDIKTFCLPNIDPPIDDLEVEARSFVWNGISITLVIIYIPPSVIYPHGFIWKNTNNFVKRVGDLVQPYSTYELSVAFYT